MQDKLDVRQLHRIHQPHEVGRTLGFEPQGIWSFLTRGGVGAGETGCVGMPVYTFSTHSLDLRNRAPDKQNFKPARDQLMRNAIAWVTSPFFLNRLVWWVGGAGIQIVVEMI